MLGLLFVGLLVMLKPQASMNWSSVILFVSSVVVFMWFDLVSSLWLIIHCLRVFVPLPTLQFNPLGIENLLAVECGAFYVWIDGELCRAIDAEASQAPVAVSSVADYLGNKHST